MVFRGLGMELEDEDPIVAKGHDNNGVIKYMVK
jgi:hypothetical protein